MEIRQVLKSSASMIPDLFYKVSGETREAEKDRDSGAEGRKERKDEEGGGKLHNGPGGEADVARRGQKTHKFRRRRRREQQRRREEREDRRRTKRETS